MRYKLLIIFCIFVVELIIPPKIFALTQTTYYVSTSGNDSNPGTQSQPFQTITKARDIIKTINSNMTGDIIVNLRNGTFQLSTPLIFNSQDSGTNGFNIIYQNYSDEIPIISGGQKISGWVADGNKWKTNVGNTLQTRQIYVNGQRAIRARSDGGVSGAIETPTGYTTADLSLQNWQNKQDIEVVSDMIWKQFRCPINNIVENSISIQEPCWTNSQLHKDIDSGWDLTMSTPTYLENAFELLDQKGEWYLNQNTGWLYYIPRDGENMLTATVIAPVLENLISGTDVSNIVFKGLTFSHATWLRPNTNEGFAEVQGNLTVTNQGHTTIYEPPVGNWTKTPANITFFNSENITFERNIFSGLGGAGLNFSSGSKNNKIIGNRFSDISATGITIGDVDKPQTTNDQEITRDIIISDNTITNVAAEYNGGVGIWLGYVQNTTINNNLLFNLPYTAISVGWGWGYNDPTIAKNNKVQNNLIYDFVKTHFDGGGIYSLSAQPGNIISGNVVIAQTTRQSWDYNLYLDQRSRYIELFNNVSLLSSQSYASLVAGGENYLHDNWWQRNDLGHDGTNLGPFADCKPTACGANKVENNHIINSISDAPGSIITSAGPRPQGLTSKTNQVSWDPVPGASKYYIRIDDQQDPWNCNGVNPQGDVCTETSSNSFSYSFRKGHTYRWWVHPIYATTNSYGPHSETTFSPTVIPGDFNDDNIVNMDDYIQLINSPHFNIFDFNTLISSFGI